MMVFTPKLALITTAVLVAVGLLWLGFVESGRSQATIAQGIGTQGFVAAAPSHSQLIAAEAMPVSHPEDNVAALAVSGSVIAALIMLALAFARFQTLNPPGHASIHPEMTSTRRPRLVTSGASQL